LYLRLSQELEEKWARNSFPQNVASLYRNIKILYVAHAYVPNHIWNCDKSRAQVGRNGGGKLIFATNGSRSVHYFILDRWKWLNVLSYVKCCRRIHTSFLYF
jgi:hypothetical protein